MFGYADRSDWIVGFLGGFVGTGSVEAAKVGMLTEVIVAVSAACAAVLLKETLLYLKKKFFEGSEGDDE